MNQWSFYKILECQAPLHKRKAPLLKTFWRRFCLFRSIVENSGSKVQLYGGPFMPCKIFGMDSCLKLVKYDRLYLTNRCRIFFTKIFLALKRIFCESAFSKKKIHDKVSPLLLPNPPTKCFLLNFATKPCCKFICCMFILHCNFYLLHHRSPWQAPNVSIRKKERTVLVHLCSIEALIPTSANRKLENAVVEEN